MLFEDAADITHKVDIDIVIFFLQQIFQHINSCVAKPETLIVTLNINNNKCLTL